MNLYVCEVAIFSKNGRDNFIGVVLINYYLIFPLKMASSSKKKTRTIASILEELDRPIYEGKWQDVQAAMKKMDKKKNPLPRALQPFLQAIELIEMHTTVGEKISLEQVETLLKTVLDFCDTEEYGLMRVMTKIKLGQLAWLRNEIPKALVTFPQMSSARVDKAPIHTSKVFMECSLYTGLCTEILYRHDKSTFSMAVSAYEECLRLALDIALLSKNLGLQVHPSVFRSIRTSLERGPLLCIKMSDSLRAIGFFRRVLMTKEEFILPQIRQICVTNLALSLLFLISPGAYSSFTFSPAIFTPSQLTEETILASLITKTFLGTLQDTKAQDASAIFDILTLTLTDARLPTLLVQVLEDSMSFTSVNSHIWLQFGLALVSNGLHQQAEAVFHECVRLAPKDPHTLLTASKLVLENSDKPDLSLQWLQSSIDAFDGHFLEPKMYYVLGECQSSLADRERTFTKRQVLVKESLVSFKKAVSLDSENINFIFRYAVQLAVSRDIPSATKQVHLALNITRDHSGCLHLLALISSAKKQYTEALKICELALIEDSHNLSILKTKILLQSMVSGNQAALKTCKEGLKIWHHLYSNENNTTPLIGALVGDQCSLSDFQLKGIDRSEEISFQLSPELLSDAGGSSHYSLSTTPALNPTLILQSQLWCTIANLFIKSESFSDASRCILEVQSLAPHSLFFYLTNGTLLEAQGQLELAIEQYNNALVLRPYNTLGLTSLGRTLHRLGRHELAEKTLREALAVDSLNHEAFFWLGKVSTAQEEHNLATDCFKTALQCEATCPLRKFETVLSKDNLL